MLYHKEIGFPENVSLPVGIRQLVFGEHAKRAAITDRIGKIRLPETVDFSICDFIEIETKQNYEIVKVVVRLNYNHYNDLILVVNPKDGFVRTCWLNRRSDKHKTLEKWRYDNP